MAQTGITAVVLNPAASGGAGARLRQEVERALQAREIPFRMAETERPGHARKLAREALHAGVDRILVVGGDGTVHEVANGLLQDDVPGPVPPIAVVPVGTGNDFFRMVGASRSVKEAMDTLEGGDVHEFEVGWARFGDGGRYFVNLLGVGVDVEVLRRRAGFRRLRGLPQYLAALATALVGFRPQEFRLSLEGPTGEIRGRTLLAAVTVGPSVGGGFLLNPSASPEDGLLDLFFVGPLGPLTIARYLPRVIRGTHQGLPKLHLRRFRKGRLERVDGQPFFFEMDGELMPDPVTALDMEAQPARLPVLLPRRVP